MRRVTFELRFGTLIRVSGRIRRRAEWFALRLAGRQVDGFGERRAGGLLDDQHNASLRRDHEKLIVAHDLRHLNAVTAAGTLADYSEKQRVAILAPLDAPNFSTGAHSGEHAHRDRTVRDDRLVNANTIGAHDKLRRGKTAGATGQHRRSDDANTQGKNGWPIMRSHDDLLDKSTITGEHNARVCILLEFDAAIYLRSFQPFASPET